MQSIFAVVYKDMESLHELVDHLKKDYIKYMLVDFKIKHWKK